MHKVTSTEFRVRFHRLIEPTEITVLGRPIGTWYPIGTEPKEKVSTPGSVAQDLNQAVAIAKQAATTFRPVPKPKR